MQSDDRQKGMQQFMDSRAQHFFLKLLFTWIWWIYYNSRLDIVVGRYEDDPSTHPDIDLDLWLEAGSSSEPNKNWVYGLSNTMIENFQTTRSVSIV